MFTRRRLFQIGSFLLAGALLALALYGVDLTDIIQAFREADYRWLLPLVVLVLGANLLRAWRWQIMIDALPPPDSRAKGDQMSSGRMLEASFSSVMIGYMINYVAPRMGEVARTANLSARTDYRFSSLFGTVVSERLFDTAVLGLALLSAVIMFFDRFGVLHQQFLVPAWTRLQAVSSFWLLGGVVLLLIVSGAVIAGVRRAMHREDSALARFWRSTVKPAIVSFNHGLRTLLYSQRRMAILLSTVGMWAGYLLMAYIPFRMLHLAEPYGIGLLDAWGLMAIGALGIVVPSPGGIGSYHYITEQALFHLFGVPQAEALTYAVLTHGAQLVFYVLVGGIAVLYQGTGLESMEKAPADASVRPSGERET